MLFFVLRRLLLMVPTTVGIAFVVSTLFYQAATFERHPVSSSAWIAGLSILLVLVVVGLRAWARNGRNGMPAAEAKA